MILFAKKDETREETVADFRRKWTKQFNDLTDELNALLSFETVFVINPQKNRPRKNNEFYLLVPLKSSGLIRSFFGFVRRNFEQVEVLPPKKSQLR